MTWNAACVLAIIIVAAGLFISDKLRAELVALLVLITLGVAGFLTPQEALSGFSRSAVITILGIFILTAGLEKTGVTRALGVWLVRLGGSNEGRMLISVTLTQVMSGQATIVILAPIAITAALELHANPRTFALGVALASSMAFLTSLGHPVNVLVMGPGGYKFSDYFLGGAILTVILLVVILVLLPIVWGL